MNRAGNSQNLATLDLVTVNTTQQSADVVASLSELEALAEHYQTSDGGGLSLIHIYLPRTGTLYRTV